MNFDKRQRQALVSQLKKEQESSEEVAQLLSALRLMVKLDKGELEERFEQNHARLLADRAIKDATRRKSVD